MDENALFDRPHLSAQTFGDEVLARELLGLFAEQCVRLVPGIRDEDAPPVHRADLAHTLRGSATAVGAGRVARLCEEIETRLRDGRGSAPVEELSACVEETFAAMNNAPSPV